MRTRARAPQRTEFRSNQPVATVPSARVGSTSLSTTLLNMQHSVGNQSVLHSLRALQARNESELEAQADSAATSGYRPAQLSHPASGSMTEIGATLRDTSKGAELDPQIRKPMEARLGADLGQVRIHSGTPASAMNRDLNSRAFALGQSIYFGEGEYQPETDRGSRLLTHELAHTVQQQSGAKAILRQPKDTPQQQPAITAQQIIGLPQGSKVLLGRTMNEFFFGKVQSLAPDVAASLQVIDKQTATLTTVNDDLVEVKLDKNVTIPARDKQPEVTYQNVTIKLARASAGALQFFSFGHAQRSFSARPGLHGAGFERASRQRQVHPLHGHGTPFSHHARWRSRRHGQHRGLCGSLRASPFIPGPTQLDWDDATEGCSRRLGCSTATSGANRQRGCCQTFIYRTTTGHRHWRRPHLRRSH